MLALGILAVALLGLMSVFVSGLRLQSQAEEITAATQVGREFLERLKASGPTVPGAGLYDGWQPDARHSSGFPPDPYPSTTVDGRDFRLTVEVADRSAGLKAVTVEVWWNRSEKVTLETYVKL